MELNNPLRPAPARSLPESASPPNEEVRKPTHAVPERSHKGPSSATLASRVEKTIAKDEITPEIKKAIDLLSNHGIQIQEPKKVYVKHSYEIEESLHEKFHTMYGVLGFKTVKEAINAALEKWCKENELEFRRRKG